MTAPRWLRKALYNQERPGDVAEVVRQARHWGRWLTNRAYRRRYNEIARLTLMPRYVPTSTTLLGARVDLADAYSFLGMYREIFLQQMYAFRAETPRPYIIDGGANVGIGVLYFKSVYPDSEIVAFEPDPEVFALLERNIRHAGCRDVELHNLALWSAPTRLEFLREGADGGRIATAADAAEKRFNDSLFDKWSAPPAVNTTRLRDYLQRPVDLLKLDVEGAETEVITDCADLLRNVKNVFVEYHSIAAEPQTLHLMLEPLVAAGFRLQIQQVTPTAPRPFLSTYLRWGMDMQLNVFGSRSTTHTKEHAVISRAYRRHETLAV
jgi:FkbM family methyltransferase